jgi:hypothetical protein
MPDAELPLIDPATPPKPRLAGWRKILFVVGMVAALLRLLMFLLLHFPAKHAAKIPTWPLHAGDVLPLTPGDPNIAKWAENPSADGFVVQQLESDGEPVPGAKVCALEPDYMADVQQPGGTLTLLDQLPTGDWRVRWSGGDTLPPFLKSPKTSTPIAAAAPSSSSPPINSTPSSTSSMESPSSSRHPPPLHLPPSPDASPSRGRGGSPASSSTRHCDCGFLTAPGEETAICVPSAKRGEPVTCETYQEISPAVSRYLPVTGGSSRATRTISAAPSSTVCVPLL